MVDVQLGKDDVASWPELKPAMQAAAGSWSQEQVLCSDLSIAVKLDEDSARTLGLDGVSRLFIQDERRCEDKVTGSVCLQTDALALTTVFMRVLPGQTNDGEIIETDIELNLASHAFAVIADANDPKVTSHHDLQAILTHEIGHVIGLEHTCTVSPFETQVDGQPSVGCSGADAQSRASVMFPTIRKGELRARYLTDDDMAAVCSVYPKGSPTPRGNEMPGGTAGLVPANSEQGSGCHVAPRGPFSAGVSLWSILAGVLVLTRLRRPHRKPVCT